MISNKSHGSYKMESLYKTVGKSDSKSKTKIETQPKDSWKRVNAPQLSRKNTDLLFEKKLNFRISKYKQCPSLFQFLQQIMSEIFLIQLTQFKN